MIEDLEYNITSFDPHFRIFHELMAFKVQNILLVSSLYDAFIMEEDGSIATQVIREYQGLSLSGAPKITRVSSVKEALDYVSRKQFDLVITMPFLSGMNAFEVGLEIKKIVSSIPIILMTHSFRMIQPFLGQNNSFGIDNIFLWCCGADLLVALVKNVEDHVNAVADTTRAMVRVIIYIEDSPADRSFFLPLIYREVVGQTQSVLDESLNEKHRLLRMRARPKVLMATNYEEALSLFEAYKPFVFGIISDARFPRKDKIDSNGGVKFLKYVREQIRDLPLLLLSAEPHNKDKAETIPAVFINKTSPSITEELHEFFNDHLGFGDFVFRMPDETEICRARTIRELEEMLRIIPNESLLFHAGRNHFSNWVMARAEVALARRLHKEYITKIENIDDMREDLVFKVHALRKLRQQGVVTKFKPKGYDPEVMDFVKMGEGSLGGKARGLAFMWARMQNVHGEGSIISEMDVLIPKTCVIAADGFVEFISDNHLFRFEEKSDDEIVNTFLHASLPPWLHQNLCVFLEKCNFPLTVRSSSLLEDGLYRPFAGLYSTYFLANNHPDFSVRLFQLENAIKLIYASTWFEGPQSFAKTTGDSRDDAMAIILQQVVGADYNGYWYPGISGVAQSHNYYPILKMQAQEGIAHIALGLGKTVVEGEKSLRFSPSHPKRLIQFSTVDDILSNCQRQFYALDMKNSAHFNREDSNLTQRGVQDAEKEFPVRILASTYIGDEHRIRDSFLPGLRVLTFAQILKYELYPMPQILSELLRFGREGMGCEVEIEFAIDLRPNPARSVFYLLQLRPMVTGGEQVDVRINEEEIQKAFCFSSQCLGHGRTDNICDILYVNPNTFDPKFTKQIAMEIGTYNRRLARKGRPYLLIGPGRWGSADPWLGIPVQWGDISRVGAMVELRNNKLRADPSQGSHFFQNITSLGIPYLTVNEDRMSGFERGKQDRKNDFLDWEWLLHQPLAKKGEYVCHLRLPHPFMMKCNGKTSESVLCSNEEKKV